VREAARVLQLSNARPQSATTGQSQTQQETFPLVGDAYVHDMMFSEAFTATVHGASARKHLGVIGEMHSITCWFKAQDGAHFLQHLITLQIIRIKAHDPSVLLIWFDRAIKLEARLWYRQLIWSDDKRTTPTIQKHCKHGYPANGSPHTASACSPQPFIRVIYQALLQWLEREQ
jgi:hypothetical protein